MAKAVNNLAFWRGAALALLTFILGNGTSYLVFGLHTVSAAQFQSQASAQDAREAAIEARLQLLEKSFNYLAGEIHAKGLDNPDRRK